MVKDREAADGNGCDEGVEHSQVHVIVVSLAREAVVPAEPELDHGEGDVLMEEQEHEEAEAHSAPTPMDEEQPTQEAELAYRVV